MTFHGARMNPTRIIGSILAAILVFPPSVFGQAEESVQLTFDSIRINSEQADSARTVSTSLPYFAPKHMMPGIGLGREGMSDDVLEKRTEAKIKWAIFLFLRDPTVVQGIKDCISNRQIQSILTKGSRESGFPRDDSEAMMVLESVCRWNAASGTGAEGIMQIVKGTAKLMGLKVGNYIATKIRKIKVALKNKNGKIIKRKGKPVYKIKQKSTTRRYIRDERLNPAIAIPKADSYLAQLSNRYGSRDMAVFAYHCGEGCAARFLEIARQTEEMKQGPITPAKLYFLCNPVHNQELCEAIAYNMTRDNSPEYWFKKEAMKFLLELARTDYSRFEQLVSEYQNQQAPRRRTPSRLWAWLLNHNNVYAGNLDSIDRISVRQILRVFNNPDYYGFNLRIFGERDNLLVDGEQPADFTTVAHGVLGTLLYVTHETRRLFEAGHYQESWVPLDATVIGNLDQHLYFENMGMQTDFLKQASGKVFDISFDNLGTHELEALKFVLKDLEDNGSIGFVPDRSRKKALLIGPSPSSLPFFNQVFQDAVS